MNIYIEIFKTLISNMTFQDAFVHFSTLFKKYHFFESKNKQVAARWLEKGPFWSLTEKDYFWDAKTRKFWTW